MNELLKCLHGQQFNCTDEKLVSIIAKARKLTKQYNQTNFEDTIQKENIYLNYLQK